MHITVEWHDKQFNVSLHSKEGADAFLTVRGCRIVDGSGEPFIGFPARKNDKTGKWWNHVTASDKFQAEVIRIAREAMPSQKAPSKPAPADEDIPFAPIGRWL